MMRFKQFLAEKTKRAFIKPALRVEPLVISTIRRGQSAEDESHNPMDAQRATRIHKFVNDTLGKIGVNPKNLTSMSTYDVSGRGAAKAARKKLKIEDSGRHAEDIIISTESDKEKKHFLLDFKLGPRGSGFNGYSKSMTNIYGLKEPLPQTHPRNVSKQTITQRMSDHFNGQSHEDKEKIVKGLLNIPDKVPSNVKRLQVQDSTEGTKIFDSDEVWNHFANNFKPTSYRSEIKGNTHRILAKNDSGEEVHVASVAPKHERKNSEWLNYNVKHYLTQNLETKGLKPLAHLVH